MSVPTASATTKGYGRLWDECTVTRPTEANALAASMLANKARYQVVAAKMRMPWAVVACLTVRESNQNFRAHLHNGDSLAYRTHQVPAGRPKTPPANGVNYTWEESAIDALTMRGLQNVHDWTIERTLYEEEAYNGWGYLGHGNSPYIWSWTNEYHGGKYIADHVFDANTWDKQPGCAALLKALATRDADTWKLVNRRGGSVVPRDVTAKSSANERATAGAGAATTATGAGTELTTDTPTEGNALAHNFLVYGLMGVGLVVLIFAAALMYKKAQLLKSKFEGGAALPPPSTVPPPPEVVPEEVPPAPHPADDPTVMPQVNAAPVVVPEVPVVPRV